MNKNISEPIRPQVSILMAVYNTEAYLGECVQSLISQTYRDWELVVVDDGSTDATLAMLNDFLAKDSRIRVISNRNQGLTPSLNLAATQSRGALLARMDGDDWVNPRRIEAQVAFLEQHPECVLVGSRTILVDPVGRQLGVRGQPLSHDAIYKRLLNGDGSALTHPGIMMRREAFTKSGAYDESFPIAQDYDLFLRMALQGELANCTESIIYWRQHPSNITGKRGSEYPPLLVRALAKHIKAIGQESYLSILTKNPLTRDKMSWLNYARSRAAWSGCLHAAFYYSCKSLLAEPASLRNLAFFLAVPLLWLRVRINHLTDRLKRG